MYRASVLLSISCDCFYSLDFGTLKLSMKSKVKLGFDVLLARRFLSVLYLQLESEVQTGGWNLCSPRLAEGDSRPSPAPLLLPATAEARSRQVK